MEADTPTTGTTPDANVCECCGRPNQYSRLDVRTCPRCGGRLQYHRGAKRISEFIYRRYRHCPSCNYSDSRLVTPERLFSFDEGAYTHPEPAHSDLDALD